MRAVEKSLYPPEAPTSSSRDPAPAAPPRRTLYRVDTTRLELHVDVRMGDRVARGQLLNISAGGCSVRLALPLVVELGTGTTFDVVLPAEGGALVCAAEPAGLDVGKGAVTLRLRFRSLTPHARTALLSWIGGVMAQVGGLSVAEDRE